MNIQQKDAQTTVVIGLQELVAVNAAMVRDQIRAALPAGCTSLDRDLSGMTFLDSSGLGVLISLHKTMRSRSGTLRLYQPAPSVQQVLELTRLHRVFEITCP